MADTVGNALRKARKARGESIVEVARETHTSPASFTKWENDQTLPSERSIRKLADYYGTDPTHFLALAFPDKYKDNGIESVDLSTTTVIRLEDLLTDKTVMTYNNKLLPNAQKELVASFAAGLVIGAAKAPTDA